MKLDTTYQLTIEVKQACTVLIGKLGAFNFPAGYYVYTGSARRYIEARIQRHLSQEKRLRWHIDYLLNAPEVHIIRVSRYSEPECDINQQGQGAVLIPHFGATDCRAGCGSHLKYLGPLADLAIVPTIPELKSAGVVSYLTF